jgi:hypothetical protein
MRLGAAGEEEEGTETAGAKEAEVEAVQIGEAEVV